MAMTDLKSIINFLPFFKHNWKFVFLYQSPFFVLLSFCTNMYAMNNNTSFNLFPLIQYISEKIDCEENNSTAHWNTIYNIKAGQPVGDIEFKGNVKIPYPSNIFAKSTYFLESTPERLIITYKTQNSIIKGELDLSSYYPNIEQSNKKFILRQTSTKNKRLFSLFYAIAKSFEGGPKIWVPKLLIENIDFNEDPYFSSIKLNPDVKFTIEIKPFSKENDKPVKIKSPIHQKKHRSFFNNYTVGGLSLLIALYTAAYVYKKNTATLKI